MLRLAATSRHSIGSRSMRSFEDPVISVGLIGCGAVVHENYAQTLIGRDAYKVRYVCDTNAKQAESAAEWFGAEAVSLDELVDRAEAIIISTPPSTHAELDRKSLRSGRLILCEKPYMTTYADALDVHQLSQAAGARVCVGQFRRLFPQLAMARKLVELGVIGEITAFSASEGGRFTWKAVSNYTTTDPNGGVLWDTGAHTLDMALFASGLDREPDFEISNIQIERDKPEPSHDFRAHFQVLASGGPVDGQLHVSRREVLPNSIRIVGSRGQLAFVTDMD